MKLARHPKGSSFVLVHKNDYEGNLLAARFFVEKDLRLKCERTEGGQFVCFYLPDKATAHDLQVFINSKKNHDEKETRNNSRAGALVG